MRGPANAAPFVWWCSPPGSSRCSTTSASPPVAPTLLRRRLPTSISQRPTPPPPRRAMSLTTQHQCANDVDLQNRVIAAASQEAWAGGPEFKDSEYGERIRTYPLEAVGTFMWAIAIDYRNEYAYAVESGKPDPGLDRT